MGYTLEGNNDRKALIYKATTSTIEFINAYETKGTVSFSGEKILNNRTIEAGEFTFELYKIETIQEREGVFGEKANLVEAVNNNESGKFAFATLNFTGTDLDTDDDGYFVETAKKYIVVEKGNNDRITGGSFREQLQRNNGKGT